MKCYWSLSRDEDAMDFEALGASKSKDCLMSFGKRQHLSEPKWIGNSRFEHFINWIKCVAYYRTLIELQMGEVIKMAFDR